MKGFGKIALVFGLLGGLMAYLIIPLQFSRKRSLSPTDKAEYALTVDYCKSHCGPVVEETEERARQSLRPRERAGHRAGFDAMTQTSVFGLTEQSVACIGVCRTAPERGDSSESQASVASEGALKHRKLDS
jgi:hypothetical protein